MSAVTPQPTLVRRERRIIERPRLIKLLDEAEARLILLLAPAGYGKTTLARQWVKTLSGTIWISSTPAHRDVVTFSEDIATGIDALGGNAGKFIDEYLRARSNPQRAAREVAGALADCMEKASVQWLVLDDYHELAESPEIEQMVAVLQERVSARFLVASRLRPAWATTRRALYGEISELDRDTLAMTSDESTAVLGRRPELEDVASQAQGWPAVLALAAGLESPSPPSGSLPAALHRYLAEELFQSAPPNLRDRLVTLALLPTRDRHVIEDRFGAEAAAVVEQARDLGFLSGEETFDLHPLLREFLLFKLMDDPDAETRVRQAVTTCIDTETWDSALDLVLRFNLADLVDRILGQAFNPLLRSGRLGTLSAFAAKVRLAPTFPPPAVDLVEAEVALRDGQFDLAIELASRVQAQLAGDDPLASRANAIVGHSSFLLAAFPESEAAFDRARRTALDDLDETEALHGLALAKIFGEQGDPAGAVAALALRRHESPVHLVRFAVAELSRRRFGEGLKGSLHLDEPLHALPQVADPRARTGFTYAAAYALGQKAEYRRALELVQSFFADVRAFELEFAMPHANWTAALIKLGLRRFGEAERCIQHVEDAVEQRQHRSHALNARSLRSRLLLQTGQPSEALHCVSLDDDLPVIPSWRGEYVATRALALARLGQSQAAFEAALAAEELSRAAEVRVLSAAARAVVSAREGTGDAPKLVSLADELGVWDPVVCALRVSPALADLLAADDSARPFLQRLYSRSNDLGLARRAGFRTRASRSPSDLLSVRELEVLGLIARGLRTREIADALYIAESTAKVHVHHVLEKLGVRTRAQAVARSEMFSDES